MVSGLAHHVAVPYHRGRRVSFLLILLCVNSVNSLSGFTQSYEEIRSAEGGPSDRYEEQEGEGDETHLT